MNNEPTANEKLKRIVKSLENGWDVHFTQYASHLIITARNWKKSVGWGRPMLEVQPHWVTGNPALMVRRGKRWDCLDYHNFSFTRKETKPRKTKKAASK